MPTDNNSPQFDTAQYGTPSTASTDRCFSCNQPIAGQYYRVNGKVACDACTNRLQHGQSSNSSSGFMRGLLFGVGAAIVGLILYATFTIVTGFYIGYVSLAVGWMVGKAVMTGSKGVGGRHYQIAAVLLTYAAVSLAEIPIALHQISKSHESTQSSGMNKPGSGAEQPSSTESGTAPSQSADQAKTADAAQDPPMSAGAIIGKLILLGLASPFLELESGFQGVIGLVILFVGLRIAWKITGETQTSMDIHGPYSTTSTASAG